MEFLVVLERNPKTGTWIAGVPAILGCHSQGASKKEALANIREALQVVLETDGPPNDYAAETAKVRIDT